MQHSKFDTCGLGVDVTAGAGMMVLLDSEAMNSGPKVRFYDSSSDPGKRQSQVVIDNLAHDGSNAVAVDSNGNTQLSDLSHVDIWVWGNVSPGTYQKGQTYTTTRPQSLLRNGRFFVKSAPDYAGYEVDQVVNVKAVEDHPVRGDGTTDDSASLNAILMDNARNCKISYALFMA